MSAQGEGRPPLPGAGSRQAAPGSGVRLPAGWLYPVCKSLLVMLSTAAASSDVTDQAACFKRGSRAALRAGRLCMSNEVGRTHGCRGGQVGMPRGLLRRLDAREHRSYACRRRQQGALCMQDWGGERRRCATTRCRHGRAGCTSNTRTRIRYALLACEETAEVLTGGCAAAAAGPHASMHSRATRPATTQGVRRGRRLGALPLMARAGDSGEGGGGVMVPAMRSTTYP